MAIFGLTFVVTAAFAVTALRRISAGEVLTVEGQATLEEVDEELAHYWLVHISGKHLETTKEVAQNFTGETRYRAHYIRGTNFLVSLEPLG